MYFFIKFLFLKNLNQRNLFKFSDHILHLWFMVRVTWQILVKTSARAALSTCAGALQTASMHQQHLRQSSAKRPST